jgi:antitoxin MazE
LPPSEVFRIFIVDTSKEALMRARVQKWGNSLAVRIPKPLALETALDQDTVVDVSVEDGRLVISPVEEPEYTLEGLLSQVTDENIHPAVDWGPSVGKEVL